MVTLIDRFDPLAVEMRDTGARREAEVVVWACGVWIVGGGSGHGFAHGPALAALVVAALRGTGTLPARFGLHERQPGRALRTAGSSAGDS